jgi:hypothetical protein
MLDDIRNAIDRSIEYITNNDVDFDSWRSGSNEKNLKNLSKQILEVL